MIFNGRKGIEVGLYIFYKKLSPDLQKRVLDVFRRIDTDGSKTIDKTETLKFWYKFKLI